MDPEYCVILSTSDKEEVAKKIALSLLEQGLAACIQIDPVDSYFKWDGKVSAVKEYRLMIKACSINYHKIEQVIVGLHNYQLPQVIKIDISGGLPDYLKWLGSKK